MPIMTKHQNRDPIVINNLNISDDHGIFINIDRIQIEIKTEEKRTSVRVTNAGIALRNYKTAQPTQSILKAMARKYLGKTYIIIHHLTVHNKAPIFNFCKKVCVRNLKYTSNGNFGSAWFDKIRHNTFDSVDFSCGNMPNFYSDAVKNCENVKVNLTGYRKEINKLLMIQSPKIDLELFLSPTAAMVFCCNFVRSRAHKESLSEIRIKSRGKYRMLIPSIGEKLGGRVVFYNGRLAHLLRVRQFLFLIQQIASSEYTTIRLEVVVSPPALMH